jgi:hypothetical protein
MSRRKKSSPKRNTRRERQVHRQLLIGHNFLAMPWQIISAQIHANEPTPEQDY